MKLSPEAWPNKMLFPSHVFRLTAERNLGMAAVVLRGRPELATYLTRPDLLPMLQDPRAFVREPAFNALRHVRPPMDDRS